MRPTRVSSSLVLVLALLLAPAAAAAATVPAGALLPDLGMAPLVNFSVQKRPKGERWLRFMVIIVNVGARPF